MRCIAVLALLSAPGIAKAGNKDSRWVDKPVVIDGNNNEWPQPYPFLEEVETRIQYAIANDAQTLYLTVKTSDNATKMKLRNNGFIIIIDTTGKKMSTTLFDFTVKNNKEASKTDTGQKLNITDIRLKGAAMGDGTYKMANNKLGIAAAGITNDMTEVVVEIAIPLKYIYPDVAGHVTAQDRIGICFTFFGLSNESINELEHANDDPNSNAMAMPMINSKGEVVPQVGEDGVGTPSIGANGAMGVGIGGGKGKGKGGNKGGESTPVIDANAMMMDRQRAGQDNQVWKVVRLGYEEQK